MAVQSKMVFKGEDKEVDPIFVGNLVEIADGGNPFVVLVTGVHDNRFLGTVVYSEDEDIEYGNYDDNWLAEKFKQFEGTITLIGSK